ncbi:uncharacterized protein LOC106778990 [Vigna radiata var. radiata]|uniref:Uncharacterized protein LOC106778990 n=1 Tax=Vigna radiata var. radiata TaxID=3916 RepID=A0A1S3VVS2_VIGRR|nr:uncharacterized protein LOC106778990 [Vigna radiata var. radiata]
MRVVFRVQGVSGVVEGTESAADSSSKDEQKKDFKQKDDKALLIIHQCVDDTHFKKIKNATSAREAWSILVRCHSRGEKVKKMKSCGETIIDVMIMEKIMRSMPPVFDLIVVAIEESKDLEKLKIEELQSSFEAYEMRRRERNSINRDDQNKKAQSKEAHLVKDESDSEPLVLMVTTCLVIVALTNQVSKEWYLDSGCSNHMTHNKEWLVNLDEGKKSNVRVTDDS